MRPEDFNFLLVHVFIVPGASSIVSKSATLRALGTSLLLEDKCGKVDCRNFCNTRRERAH